MEARGPPEIHHTQTSDHPAVVLVNHPETYGVKISISCGMNVQERTEVLAYDVHASASRAIDFIHIELAEKFQAGHIAFFRWDTIVHLEKLWLSLVNIILQECSQLRIIFELTWSGLNMEATPQAPRKAMQFRGSL